MSQQPYPPHGEPGQPQGYPPPGYPQQGQAQESGYAQPGYPQPGYPQAGYPQPGYPQSGYAHPGQPHPGQPQPGQPQQPGYPNQPGYPQQSGHPQPAPGQQWPGQPDQQGQYPPGYPQQPYPQQAGTWGPPEQPTSSSKGLVIGLVAVLVLAVAGVGIYVGTRGGGGGGTTTADGGLTGAKRTTVSAPATLNGASKSSLGNNMDSALKASEAELKSIAPGAQDFVVGIYDGLILTAANGKFDPPTVMKTYEDKLRKNAISSIKLTGPSAVDAGPLGGEARCATMSTSAGSTTLNSELCFWANESVFGAFTTLTGKAKVKDNFLKLRSEVEKVS